MPPGESLCPGDSEYVWQIGVEGISGRLTDGQNLLYFPKKETMGRSDLSLEAQIRKLWEWDFFATAKISFLFFGK